MKIIMNGARVLHEPSPRFLLRSYLKYTRPGSLPSLPHQQHPLPHGGHRQSFSMSWMDSWSRPSKSQSTPVPYYLLPGGDSVLYCRSCGRVISSKRTNAAEKAKTATPPSYCSQRCRTNKPGKLDREIEQTFVKYLQGPSKDKNESRPAKSGRLNIKGDARILVFCSDVENEVFGARRGEVEAGLSTEADLSPVSDEASSHEDVDEEGTPGVPVHLSVRSGTRIRPPQSSSDVNGSVGGEKGRAERSRETDSMLQKRKEGDLRAKEREMVKCAARRGVVFGFADNTAETSDKEQRVRLCEAVMSGKVVEPSFAKGDWAIRWRE